MYWNGWILQGFLNQVQSHWQVLRTQTHGEGRTIGKRQGMCCYQLKGYYGRS